MILLNETYRAAVNQIWLIHENKNVSIWLFTIFYPNDSIKKSAAPVLSWNPELVKSQEAHKGRGDHIASDGFFQKLMWVSWGPHVCDLYPWSLHKLESLTGICDWPLLIPANSDALFLTFPLKIICIPHFYFKLNREYHNYLLNTYFVLVC